MNKQNYYNITNIYGEEIETLLLQLKELLLSKKITDNLPENVNAKFNEIEIKLSDVIKSIEDLNLTNLSIIDGGDYRIGE